MKKTIIILVVGFLLLLGSNVRAQMATEPDSSVVAGWKFATFTDVDDSLTDGHQIYEKIDSTTAVIDSAVGAERADTTIAEFLHKEGGVMTGNITMPDDGWIGIGSSVERIVFDGDGGDIEIMGADVGIGIANPSSITHIKGNTPGTVGSHPAGQLIIQNPTASVLSNVVITAYSSDVGGAPNQQLWYLGSSSISNSDITFLNRRSACLVLGTNNLTRLTISETGNIGIGTTAPPQRLSVVGNIATGDSATGDVDVYHYFSTDASWTTEYLKWDDGLSQFMISDDIDVTGNITVSGDAYHITSAETDSQFMSKKYIDDAAGGLSAQSVKGDHVDSTSEDFVFDDPYRGTSAEAESLLLTHGGAAATYVTATLTEEEVEDYVGTMVDGGTETRIAVTYTDGGDGAGLLNFVVDDMNDGDASEAAIGESLHVARPWLDIEDDGYIGLGTAKIEFLDETADSIRMWCNLRGHIGSFTTLSTISTMYVGSGFTVSAGSVVLPDNQIHEAEIDWGTGAGQVQATFLPDFGTMTATDDNILVADGTDFESVAVTGDVGMDNGAITLGADVVDEAHIADNGIDSEHYNDGSVDLVHLAAGVYAVDLVATSPMLVDGGTNVDNILVGADANVTVSATIAKDIVATLPLTVNAGANLDDVIIGTDADITIAIADADDDGSTKGAASFDNTDFNATGGNVTIVDDGHAHTTTSVSGLDVSDDINLTAGDHITLTDDDLNVDDDFVINSGNDVMTGILTADGLTLGQDENITLGSQTLDHDGTSFVFDDDVVISGIIVTSDTLTKGFVIQAPDEDHDLPLWMTPKAITLIAVSGVAVGGTNVVGVLMEYDNDAANPAVCNSSDWTFTTGEERTTSLSNASIDAGDWLGWKTTSVSGEVNFISITFEYTQP